jgi:hypothetical protein
LSDTDQILQLASELACHSHLIWVLLFWILAFEHTFFISTSLFLQNLPFGHLFYLERKRLYILYFFQKHVLKGINLGGDHSGDHIVMMFWFPGARA